MKSIIPEDGLLITSLDARRHRLFSPIVVAVGWDTLIPVMGKSVLNTYVEPDSRVAYNQIFSRPFYAPELIHQTASLKIK